jgi:transposase, IS5 family
MALQTTRQLNSKQQGFAQQLASERMTPIGLDGVDALVNWDSIEGMLACIHCNKKSVQAWSLLMMFKALLIQSWYNLSDTLLESQLARDLLFREFVGLSFADTTPDQVTLWQFRNNPKVQALLHIVLGEINDQLAEKNLHLMQGAICILNVSMIEKPIYV